MTEIDFKSPTKSILDNFNCRFEAAVQGRPGLPSGYPMPGTMQDGTPVPGTARGMGVYIECVKPKTEADFRCIVDARSPMGMRSLFASGISAVNHEAVGENKTIGYEDSDIYDKQYVYLESQSECLVKGSELSCVPFKPVSAGSARRHRRQ